MARYCKQIIAAASYVAPKQSGPCVDTPDTSQTLSGLMTNSVRFGPCHEPCQQTPRCEPLRPECQTENLGGKITAEPVTYASLGLRFLRTNMNFIVQSDSDSASYIPSSLNFGESHMTHSQC
jgi:hypothetical protein